MLFLYVWMEADVTQIHIPLNETRWRRAAAATEHISNGIMECMEIDAMLAIGLYLSLSFQHFWYAYSF